MPQQTLSPATHSRPLLAVGSILIAVVVAITWIASIVSSHLGAAPATAGMVLLGTIPLALAGTALSMLSLMFRNENKHFVQYGLWINGLFAFFAFPVMVVVLV